MKKKTKLIAIAAATIMAMGMSCTVFGASNDSAQTEWTVSKSKTATNLDKNYESQITLSLPAEEAELMTDVVFVLDKSLSDSSEEAALSMLEDLRARIGETNAKVKVGVVIFNKVANVTDFKDLSTEYDDIKKAMEQKISSGTNMQAGMLAAKKMLDDDKVVDNSRKYLILVSDGLTYYYCKGDDYTKAYTTSALNGGDDGNGSGNCQPHSGLDNWDIKYGRKYTPGNWSEFFAAIETIMKDTDKANKYEYEVGSADLPKSGVDKDNTEKSIPYKARANYLINADKSLYGTYQLYKQAAKDYNCYAIFDKENATYSFGKPFMAELGKVEGGNGVDFAKIEKEIYYFIDAGSYVIDEMGKTDDYDFNFIDNVDQLELTVGGEVLEADKLENPNGDATSSYGFGKTGNSYKFVLDYYKDGVEAEGKILRECFIWNINTPVTIDKHVQLTYSVKLANPKQEAGTYGEYDRDGSQDKTALFTNNSAVLYPVTSKGTKGAPEAFNKPTVSYVVTSGQAGDEGNADTKDNPANDEKAGNDKTAKTGDNFGLIFSLITITLAAVGSVIAIARRKRI